MLIEVQPRKIVDLFENAKRGSRTLKDALLDNFKTYHQRS